MNTHPTDEQLSAFNDAHLDGAQMRRVARHVEDCETCQTSAHALQTVRERLQSLPAPPVPSPDFWADTLRQMRVDAHERRAAPPTLLFGARRHWAASVTACAVLGAALVAPLLTHTMRPVPDTPATLADSVDVSALVQAHAQSAARQPLADADRQTLLAADGDPLLASDASDADAAR